MFADMPEYLDLEDYDVNFSATCPFCQTRQVAFTFINEFVCVAAGSNLMTALAACNKCDGCVMASFAGGEASRRLLQTPVRLDPSPSPDVPRHTPGVVEQRYEEALNNMGCESHESAVMMLRKTLQLALGEVVPRKGRKLVDQIKDAAAAGVISKELADSADVVRLGGNVAAHEEAGFSAEEVLALKDFTEMVLMYLFTLPGMLKEWKKRVAAKGK